MELNELYPTFQTDSLPEDVTQDTLNRRKFIETLATKILEFEDPNCLIIGIHGPWGSGKSTFIKFLESEMSDKCEEIVIVHFNPWNFSSLNQLVTMFFREIKFAIGKGSSARDITLEIGEKLEILGKVLAPLGAIPPITKIGLLPVGLKELFPALEKAGSGMKQLAEQNPSALKKELDKLMAKYGKRVIILIDDIDRLDKESMSLVFKLIRLNADFINTIYILSFDRKVVENALEGEQGVSGREYLEKFIQVPFDLPLPDHKKIAEILSEKLEKIFPPSAKEEFESYRGYVICRKFYMFFRTLRDVKRYSNGILLTLPSINDEIDYLDFAALEAIRIFCPDVYNELAKNKEILLGNKPQFSLDLNRDQIEKRKEDINNIIKSKCEDKYQAIIVLDLIHELFPYAGEAAYYGHDQCHRIDKRICSSNRFDKYFLLDVPEGEISQFEIDSALKIINDKELFIRLLREYNEHGILMQFLDRMKDYINEISPENAKNIIDGFFDVGDELSIMDNGRINRSIKSKIGFLILDIIERIEDPVIRSGILVNCIENAKGIYILLYVVFYLNKDINKKIISQDELQIIKDLAVKRIREYASKKDFIKRAHINSILFRWRDFGNANEPKNFASNLIEDDKWVIKLLVEFLTESYTGPGVHYSLEHHNLEELSEFVDLSIIYSKLIKIKQKNPKMIEEGLEKIAAEDFIKLYESVESNANVLE